MDLKFTASTEGLTAQEREQSTAEELNTVGKAFGDTSEDLFTRQAGVPGVLFWALSNRVDIDLVKNRDLLTEQGVRMLESLEMLKGPFPLYPPLEQVLSALEWAVTKIDTEPEMANIVLRQVAQTTYLQFLGQNVGESDVIATASENAGRIEGDFSLPLVLSTLFQLRNKMGQPSDVGVSTRIFTGIGLPSQLSDPNFNNVAQNILSAHVFSMKNNSEYWKQVEELATEFYNLHLSILFKRVETGTFAITGDLIRLLIIARIDQKDPRFITALANVSSKKLN